MDGLFDTSKKESHPVERMMVAFNRNCSLVLYYAGMAIHSDIDGLGPGELVFESPNTPDRGVWVWEGVPRAVCAGGEFDYFDYDQSGWRKPTVREWIDVRNGKSLWIWSPPTIGQLVVEPEEGSEESQSDKEQINMSEIISKRAKPKG